MIGLHSSITSKLLATFNEDDASEEVVKQGEDAAFSCGKTDAADGVAVARKLTAMSQVRRGFLADEMLLAMDQRLCLSRRMPDRRGLIDVVRL